MALGRPRVGGAFLAPTQGLGRRSIQHGQVEGGVVLVANGDLGGGDFGVGPGIATCATSPTLGNVLGGPLGSVGPGFVLLRGTSRRRIAGDPTRPAQLGFRPAGAASRGRRSGLRSRRAPSRGLTGGRGRHLGPEERLPLAGEPTLLEEGNLGAYPLGQGRVLGQGRQLREALGILRQVRRWPVRFTSWRIEESVNCR